MLEKSIQRSVVEYAKKKGWLTRKFSQGSRFGSNGDPDVIFLREGRAFFIEFKSSGKSPTELQRHRHRELREAGFRVHVVDSVADGRKVIDHETGLWVVGL